MAPTSTALTVQGPSDRLDPAQTLKASHALVKHIKLTHDEHAAHSKKQNLLAVGNGTGDSDEEAADEDDVPVWLILTTKKHITDQKRLKPGKIKIPHSLNSSPNATVCLITVDPQRSFKDAIASPAFPAPLRSRITRVIGISKLRSKYKSFESRRQLVSEHELFLADDRVITMLPNVLGKAFYKVTAKRPIPVNIAGPRKAKDLTASKAREEEKSVAPPKAIADEITRTLSTALVYLSPSTCTSIRVGKASWDGAKVAENIDAVVAGLVEKHVAKKWRGVRGLHIKGPNTAALPIWLADELWADEEDVMEVDADAHLKVTEPKAIEAAPSTSSPSTKKRKRKAERGEKDGDEAGEEKSKKAKTEKEKEKKSKKQKGKVNEEDGGENEETKAKRVKAEAKERREKIKSQKRKALAEVEAEVEKAEGEGQGQEEGKGKKEKERRTKKVKSKP
ncbi:MAG: hypothetical protein M1838_005093 [Thelocarpon superellum]|nr:MAG: hypothetical protein M1838_005093 [Thelocarpon superellum]